MNIQEGKACYLYEERAVDCVCKAHVLHILPHPDSDDDKLIVYRWYGTRRRHWWYGVTTISKQEFWAEYVEKVVQDTKERRKQRKLRKQRGLLDAQQTNLLPKPVK